jgi:hypothetical protein
MGLNVSELCLFVAVAVLILSCVATITANPYRSPEQSPRRSPIIIEEVD